MKKRNVLLSAAMLMLSGSLIISNSLEATPVVDFIVGFLQGGSVGIGLFNFIACRKGEENPCDFKKRLLNQKA